MIKCLLSNQGCFQNPTYCFLLTLLVFHYFYKLTSAINMTSTNFTQTNTSSPADVAVIGGGVIGVCAALVLQKSGKNVVLIERDSVGGGASAGNAGHIASEQVYPIASPDILKDIPKMLLDPLGPLRIDYRQALTLAPWFLKLLSALRPKPFTRSCQALQQINSLSLPAWQQLLKEENLTELMLVNGSYLIAEKPQSIEILRKKIAGYHAANVAVEWVDKNTLHEQVPILNDNQLGGLFFPETAHVIDPQRLCQALEKQFHAYGGKTLMAEVYAIKDSQEFVTVAVKQQPSVRANQAVITSGVFSADLVKSLSGINPPLQAERGYHLMTQTPTDKMTAPVTSFDRRFIMTPMQHGLRLAGTVEYSSITAKPNYQRATNLLKLANGMLKTPLIQSADEPWMGIRPTLPDSLPVIERIGNIGYAFGHQHLGLTHAAITGQWLNQLMNDQTIDVDLSPYRLQRFQ